MNSAAKCLVGISLMVAATANAQVTVWLENPAGPQAGSVNLEVGQTALVQLWLEVPEATILVNVDAILRGLDASFAKDLNFEVVGFNDVTIPDSQMQRVGRGDITDDLPNGFIDDYQYLADDANFPLDQNSGLTGPATVLLDEIIIQGIDENTADGPDQIMFAPGAQAPGGFEMVYVEVPPPGTWNVAEVTDVQLGTGSVDEPFLVNVVPVGGEPPNGGGGGGEANENVGDDDNENVGDDDNENAADEDNDNEAPPDTDSDGDGITDQDEEDAGTDPEDADTDDDGIPDGVEVENGLDPTEDDAGDDDDGDGLDNAEEIDAGTDPGNADTDGDGENDDTDPDPNDPTVTTGARRTGGGGARGQAGGPCGVGLFGPLFFAVLVLRLGRGRR